MNWQNIPRKDKVVKRAVRSTRPDGVLVLFDYGQIEARLAAYFMSRLGWDGLLKDILAGVDVHRRMACIVYGVKAEAVTEEMRDRAKTCFFGMLYGAGGKRFAEILNASGPANWKEFSGERLRIGPAKSIVADFRAAMPGLEILQDACERGAKKKGYLELFTGRQLKPEPYGEHKLPNALIQGTAAEIMKRAILRIYRELPKHSEIEAWMTGTIHDEIILDAPPAELAWLGDNIPPLMVEAEFDSVVPIIVDMEVARVSWADTEKWEREAA